MNPQDTNTQQPVQPPQPTPPVAPQPSKNRGIFWLIAPALSVIVGLVVAFANSFTSFDSAIHTFLNLVAYLFIGVGTLAFIPGLIYGIVLLNKK